MRWLPWWVPLLVLLAFGAWLYFPSATPSDVEQKNEAIRGLSKEVQRQVLIKESAMRRVESLERESQRRHQVYEAEPPVRSLQEARDALARQLRTP